MKIMENVNIKKKQKIMLPWKTFHFQQKILCKHTLAVEQFLADPRLMWWDFDDDDGLQSRLLFLNSHGCYFNDGILNFPF